MAFTKDGVCQHCLLDIKLNETEVVFEFYRGVVVLYLQNHNIYFETDSGKNSSLIKRLEELGYLTSMCASIDSVLLRPTGVEIANDRATICANREEHDALNYAF